MQSKMDYAVFRTGIILGIIGFWAVQTGGEVEQETDMYSRQQSKLLNQLINESRYDSRLRPNLDGRPIVVICDFYVASFGELDEIAMDYSVDIFFRQSWNDPRLKHTGINGDNKTLALPAKMLDKIWIPDSFFSNEKMARGHDITVPNKLIRIYSTGNVMFSNRPSVYFMVSVFRGFWPIFQASFVFVAQLYTNSRNNLRFSFVFGYPTRKSPAGHFWTGSSSKAWNIGENLYSFLVSSSPFSVFSSLKCRVKSDPYITGSFSAECRFKSGNNYKDKNIRRGMLLWSALQNPASYISYRRNCSITPLSGPATSYMMKKSMKPHGHIFDLSPNTFGYDDTDIVFKWKAEKAVELNPDLELPQFELDDDIELTENCERRYTTGNFSCLRSTFKLARKFGFFLLQTYIPSVLIVILSWVSFWIHPDAVPARISLGVTTVLTMTTQLSGSRASIPKVSYPKAIDVWMATCMLFVFSALIEYALVNVLSRQISKRIARRLVTLAEPPAEPATDPLDSDDAKEIDERQGVEKNTMKPNSNANKGDKAAEKPSTMETCYRSFFRLIDCPVGPGNRNLSSSIDKSSRYGFPLSFLLFNIVYWSVYSSYSPE